MTMLRGKLSSTNHKNCLPFRTTNTTKGCWSRTLFHIDNTVTDYKHSRRNMTLPIKNTGTTSVYRHILISGWNVAQEPSIYFTIKQYVFKSFQKDYLTFRRLTSTIADVPHR